MFLSLQHQKVTVVSQDTMACIDMPWNQVKTMPDYAQSIFNEVLLHFLH